jgi:MYXO-CTERM domain-containing protein
MRQLPIASLVGGIGLLVATTGVHAAALLEDHFESPETVGSASSGWDIPASVSAKIVDTSADTNPSPDPLGAQAMAITNGASGYTSQGFTVQTSGTFQTDAYVRVNNDTYSDTFVMVLSGGNGAGALMLFSGGGLYYGQNGVYGGPVAGFAIGKDDWFHVTVDTNMDTKTWNVSVANLNDSTQSTSASNLAFFAGATADTMSNLGFGPIYGGVDATVDNVKVGSVPEPASMTLLALGGLLLIRRRT